MNRDPISTFLVVGLLLSVLATAGICYWYLQTIRQLHTATGELQAVNRDRLVFQQFANHAMEYGERNPAIIPILESVGIRRGPRPAAGQTNSIVE